MNNVIGIGTDIVEVARIGDMIEKHDETFVQKVFTEGEIRSLGRKRSDPQSDWYRLVQGDQVDGH